ncbi:nucleotide pyrophosphatase [Halorubrum sp. Atlit-8R]|nr:MULTISPECIES: alkaline phosphatase family protein [unclassified Halorubrum]RLM71599.1 nucleotide pyrophosphatase [Halorubrum sp. Atlit-9R]RLM82246.1 nucleotide pyrophosphatase [Halorubrum sp. Atlit-8R]
MTTVVLGLDGAAFELIEDWIDSGVLPNLAKLTSEGAAMDMRSCLPPVTSPNWRCYASGVNPGKLGVFWWERVNRETHTVEPISSSEQFDGGEYWDLLDGNVSVINLPTGSPPSKVNGKFIAGGPDCEQTEYTHPHGLEDQLRDEYDYQVHPDHLSQLSKDNQENDCVDEIHRLIEQRFQVLEDQLESGEYTLIHATIFYINVLHHFYWDRDVVRTGWEIIDEHIGTLLESDELDHLFVMSDHGSNRIEVEFNINTWLEEEGYLVRQTGANDLMKRIGITRERVLPVLNQLGFRSLARQIVPDRVKSRVPDSEGRVKKQAKSELIDWEESTAVASGQGPIYVLTDSTSERRAIREELLEELDGLRDRTGTLVVEAAKAADIVYEGPYVDDGPDILLDQAPNIHISGALGSDRVFVDPDTWAGENKDTGLFIAYGPAVDPEATVEEMNITDIAPTLLTLHQEPIPKEMDGTVRTGLFAEGTEMSKRIPQDDDIRWIKQKTTEDDQTGDSVNSRLADLGYIDE